MAEIMCCPWVQGELDGVERQFTSNPVKTFWPHLHPTLAHMQSFCVSM